jgi:hypothetical protein
MSYNLTDHHEAIELLPSPNSTRALHENDTQIPGVKVNPVTSTHDIEDGHQFSKGDENDGILVPTTRQKSSPQWLVFHDRKEVFYLILVALNVIPIALLTAYSPRLSKDLGSMACLPNGEFILPGTANIWERDLFFTIVITLGKGSQWSYTHVRIIDLIWDVAVGRGGQLLLLYVAYNVFHKSITYIMDSQPVSYQIYGAVAFRSGTVRSIFAILHACATEKFKNTRRTYRLYTAMILATAYIVSMPSLFSAMTGYAALYAPSVEIPPIQAEYVCADLGGCKVELCGGPGATSPSGDGLVAGWGTCIDSMRFNYGSPYVINLDKPSDPVRQYYSKYKGQYDAAASDPRCRNVSTLADCPPLAMASTLDWTKDLTINLTSPMLNIQLWGTNESSGIPNVWLCDGLILNTKDFPTDGRGRSGNLTGMCNAGNEYQWGFSYLMLLLVCILNFIFTAMMYGLWIEAHRNDSRNMYIEQKSSKSKDGEKEDASPSLLKDALFLASQAEEQYGQEIREWSSRKLQKTVWDGKKGMRLRRQSNTY